MSKSLRIQSSILKIIDFLTVYERFRVFILFFKRTYQGWNIWGDPIIEKSQDQDQGQGQGQDHLLPQRAALPQLIWSWPSSLTKSVNIDLH